MRRLLRSFWGLLLILSTSLEDVNGHAAMMLVPSHLPFILLVFEGSQLVAMPSIGCFLGLKMEQQSQPLVHALTTDPVSLVKQEIREGRDNRAYGGLKGVL